MIIIMIIIIIIIIIIITIIIIIIISIYIYIYIYLFRAQRRSSFSKVSHHLGVYFLRFVELLHGESVVKAYPKDHVCVCVHNSLLRELSS